MWFLFEYTGLFGYESSTMYLLKRLPHAGLYTYNGMQIELFYIK